MRIGILALQGAFEEHRKMLSKLNVESFEIRQKDDFAIPYQNKAIDGLIIPGGESTTISKLLNDLDLYDDIREAILEGLPTLGTCAGMILLGKTTDPLVKSFEVLDMQVKRNAFGRQLGSFAVVADYFANNLKHDVNMVFIRGPLVKKINDPQINILSKVNGQIVAVNKGKIIATAFHPELTDDLTVHKHFLSLI